MCDSRDSDDHRGSAHRTLYSSTAICVYMDQLLFTHIINVLETNAAAVRRYVCESPCVCVFVLYFCFIFISLIRNSRAFRAFCEFGRSLARGLLPPRLLGTARKLHTTRLRCKTNLKKKSSNCCLWGARLCIVRSRPNCVCTNIYQRNS